MALSAQQIRRVVASVRQVAWNAPAIRVEDFFSTTLGLNVAQRGQYFPNPDPNGLLETAIGHLTQQREKMLRDECSIPDFAVYQDAHKTHYVAGLDTYLAAKKADAKLRGRLARHNLIRAALRGMKKGHDLEALAAAIMHSKCDYGEATRGSGDQGIDAIGWIKLVLIDSSFCEGHFRRDLALPGEKVFLFASSKAFTDSRGVAPKLISPAHIRELVGGWVIQRSSVGKWQSAGIRMLSPVQMILVTTYRLSIDAKAECRSLGIQVWGIPELIYLICLAAPNSVFDAANNYAFSKAKFKEWWKVRDQKRLSAI